MNIRGIVAGVLTLTFLQAVVSTPAAAGRVGGLFAAASKAFQRVIDPSVPLVPDRRVRSLSGSSSSGSGYATPPPLKGPSPATAPAPNPAPIVAPAPTPTRPQLPHPIPGGI